MVFTDPWMRFNTQMLPVCFGTRDNHFGRFWIPVSGSLVAVKPVHVSGTVSCYTPNEASWSFRGCDESNYTVITNSSDYMIIFCSHKASNFNSHFPDTTRALHSSFSQNSNPLGKCPLLKSSVFGTTRI